jgi:predicted nucleic acid-binding protein
MNNATVCLDASVLISLVTPEDLSEQAERLWEQCTRARVVRVAPALLRYEVTAVLRKKLWRGLLRDDQAERALTTVLGLPVQCLDPRGLHRLAWDLAHRLGQPSAYDAHYLALAEMLDCRCWTGDKRLYNGVHASFDRLSWLGDA